MSIHKVQLTVQWHITTKCNNRCKHCYVYDPSTYANEAANSLKLRDLIRILDRFEAFEQKWQARISRFVISGGDPLLREDWQPFFSELADRGKQISVLGNPDTLTEETVARLARIGVQSFQMSLDGLEQTHDRFRSKHSFRQTVEKLSLLQRYRIHSNIMFTLFPDNSHELIPLLRYVAENTCATSFNFDMGCFVGNATQLKKGFFPDHLQQLFTGYLAEKKRLIDAGYALHIGEKANLLKLSRFQNQELYPVCSRDMSSVSGCLAGWTGVTVLNDGTVLACRRLPLKVGNLLEQSFEEIFLGSDLLKKLRRPEYFMGCGKCDFYKFCRGCPSMVSSLTGGDPFAENPLCFRHLINRKTEAVDNTTSSPPMEASYEEEFNWVAGRLSSSAQDRFTDLAENKNFNRVFVTLTYSLKKRRAFLSEPNHYISKLKHPVTEDAGAFLMHHFSNYPDHDIAPGSLADRLGMSIINRMLRPQPKENNPNIQELIVRAWEEEDFMRDLQTNTKTTIESALGIILPKHLEFYAHEQRPNVFHLLLPTWPSEFDDEA